MPVNIAEQPGSKERIQLDPLPPLLKWAGGKRWLVADLLASFPNASGSYYFEPFLGGAAVYFAFRPKRSILSDTNRELINCYRQVKNEPHSVLRALRNLRNTEVNYYRIRAWQPTDAVERAARLLYLTTLSFNGIFRQNLDGVFNVPYGKKTHVDPVNPARIIAASEALKGAQLVCKDFEHATDGAGPGDIVYFDPPYTVAHGNNGFVKYNAKIFSWDDQIRLAKTAARLSARGCFVFISNADHPSIRDLYKGFDLKVVARQSKIAAAREYRKAITECLFFNAEVIRAGASERRRAR